MRCRISAINLCLLAGFGLPGSAQTIPVQTGDLVRVHIAGQAPIEGFVQSQDPGTLSLTRNDMRRPVVIPARSITGVERGDVVGHHARQGAVIGMAFGAGLGLLIAATGSSSEHSWNQVSAGEAVIGTLGLSGVGAGIGAIIGGLWPHREWHRLDIGAPHVTPLSARPMGRTVIGLSVSF